MRASFFRAPLFLTGESWTATTRSQNSLCLEFKYFRVLFISDSRAEWDVDRQIGAMIEVTQLLSIVVKIELNQKASLAIYSSVNIPFLTSRDMVVDQKDEIQD